MATKVFCDFCGDTITGLLIKVAITRGEGGYPDTYDTCNTCVMRIKEVTRIRKKTKKKGEII